MIIATVARRTDSAAGTDLRLLVDSLPANTAVLIDLYVTSETSEDEAGGPDARADRIRDKLGIIPAARSSGSRSRCACPTARRDEPAWFTFYGAPDGGEATEDRTQRGLHPMVAERLGLWRLTGFELTRLPAATDVHLFRVQGREVPDDQRLIALADVRDLTIVRDEDGRIRGVPQIERTLDACLDSLRSARSADRNLAKLDWNRVQLYVWPVVDVPLTDLDPVVRSLAPRTEALGLEQVLVQFRLADAERPGR